MQLIAKTVLNGSLLLPFQINESEKHCSQSHPQNWASPPPGFPLNRDKDLQLNAVTSYVSESHLQAAKTHARILFWNPVCLNEQGGKEKEKDLTFGVKCFTTLNVTHLKDMVFLEEKNAPFIDD